MIAGDGVYSQLENKEIKLVDLESNKTRVLLSVDDVTDVSFLIFLENFELLNGFRILEIRCTLTVGNYQTI